MCNREATGMNEYGLTLCSDGSKNSYEIGIVKALQELKSPISSVSAAYMGVLNAALIAQDDFECMIRFWRSISKHNIFDLFHDISIRYTASWSSLSAQQFLSEYIDYILSERDSLAIFRRILNEHISEEKLRTSGIDFGIVSLSPTTLKFEAYRLSDIAEGELIDHLMLCSCFPQIAELDEEASGATPYGILESFGTKRIISTDDITPVPKKSASEIHILYPSELIQLNLAENTEQMVKSIKLGYIDTYRLLCPSAGETYFISQLTEEGKTSSLKANIGRKLPAHLNQLVKMLLRSSSANKETVEGRLKKMLSASGIEADNFYLSLLENLARILQISKDEKYTDTKLRKTIVSEINRLIADNVDKVKSTESVSKLINEVSDPGKNLPAPNLFSQYFLLLVAADPDDYEKLQSFVGCLHLRSLVAIVTLIYLVF